MATLSAEPAPPPVVQVPKPVDGIDNIIAMEGLRPGMMIHVTSLLARKEDIHTQGQRKPSKSTMLKVPHPAIVMEVQRGESLTVALVRSFAKRETLEAAGIVQDSRERREGGQLGGPIGFEKDPQAEIQLEDRAAWVYIRQLYMIKPGAKLRAPEKVSGPLGNVYSEESLRVIRAVVGSFGNKPVDVNEFCEELETKRAQRTEEIQGAGTA
ncbi:hypothetical protein LXA43DRAFT_1061810 [Ganoderma leucocontextum]|nr:hypothetical protein LXA43DRAFT_1061810 [Ganoderma leucocontextum]